MRQFSIAPWEMIAELWRKRALILALTRREIISRYKGSALGLLWSLFNPLFMLAVYTFVFGVVFNSRWSEASESKGQFALILFAGMIVFNLFAECTNKAPMTIVSNVNYVKKVLFPLEILPVVNAGAAIFHTAVSVIVWLAFYGIEVGVPVATVWMVPFAILPPLIMSIGLGWFLASLGVYLRDVSQVVGIFTTILMFLSPIFFPASAVPPSYQVFLNFNPLAPAIKQMRDAIYFGVPLDPYAYGSYLAASMIFAWLCFAWFQKTRRGFADVL